jgi:hypothetical protein
LRRPAKTVASNKARVFDAPSDKALSWTMLEKRFPELKEAEQTWDELRNEPQTFRNERQKPANLIKMIGSAYGGSC